MLMHDWLLHAADQGLTADGGGKTLCAKDEGKIERHELETFKD